MSDFISSSPKWVMAYDAIKNSDFKTLERILSGIETNYILAFVNAITPEDNYTLGHVVADVGSSTCTIVLGKYEANFNIPNAKGLTALSLAKMRHHYDVEKKMEETLVRHNTKSKPPTFPRITRFFRVLRLTF